MNVRELSRHTHNAGRPSRGLGGRNVLFLRLLLEAGSDRAGLQDRPQGDDRLRGLLHLDGQPPRAGKVDQGRSGWAGACASHRRCDVQGGLLRMGPGMAGRSAAGLVVRNLRRDRRRQSGTGRLAERGAGGPAALRLASLAHGRANRTGDKAVAPIRALLRRIDGRVYHGRVAGLAVADGRTFQRGHGDLVRTRYSSAAHVARASMPENRTSTIRWTGWIRPTWGGTTTA